jgi:hypothetical protein
VRLGGYSGFSESQLEYSIIGGTGTSVSLNNADYADSANFTSGRLTPAIMIAEFKKNSDFIRARALAGLALSPFIPVIMKLWGVRCPGGPVLTSGRLFRAGAVSFLTSVMAERAAKQRPMAMKWLVAQAP